MLFRPSLPSPSLRAIAPADAALLARLHAVDAALGLGPGPTCPAPPIGAPCTLTAARVARAVAHLHQSPPAAAPSTSSASTGISGREGLGPLPAVAVLYDVDALRRAFDDVQRAFR